jgi:hypothetical protein
MSPDPANRSPAIGLLELLDMKHLPRRLGDASAAAFPAFSQLSNGELAHARLSRLSVTKALLQLKAPP